MIRDGLRGSLPAGEADRNRSFSGGQLGGKEIRNVHLRVRSSISTSMWSVRAMWGRPSRCATGRARRRHVSYGRGLRASDQEAEVVRAGRC